MTRTMHTLWILRQSDDSQPELLVAWDDFSVDDYREGYESECAAALDAVGNDVKAFRYIDLIVPMDAINAAFNTAVVKADAKAAER